MDLDAGRMRCSIPVPGRTRWALYDPDADEFYVNIADPALIVAIDARDPTRVSRTIAVPASGPHGLDLDIATPGCSVRAMPASSSPSTRVRGASWTSARSAGFRTSFSSTASDVSSMSQSATPA
jgi:hypothetical protein